MFVSFKPLEGHIAAKFSYPEMEAALSAERLNKASKLVAPKPIKQQSLFIILLQLIQERANVLFETKLIAFVSGHLMFPTMHLRLCSFKCNGKVFPVHSMKAYEI
jgi:hypothetical protein